MPGVKNDLSHLSKHLIELQEKELTDIGRILHDDVGQSLTVVKLVLEKARRMPPENINSVLDQLIVEVNQITKRVSNLSLDLRPSILDDIGLIAALDWLFRRYETLYNLHVDFNHSRSSDSFSPEINTAVFRIVREALNNIIVHACIKQASIRIASGKKYVSFSISDKGCGFNVDDLQTKSSVGIVMMRERSELLDGIFSISSNPGRGTRITVKIPIIS
jgi:signal transduction histidine kinase